MSDSTRAFFDALSPDYTAAILRCAPRYQEMLAAIVDYIPAELQPRRILELGCGTGNLSQVVAGTWPTAELTLVDISAELLKQCRQRLGDDARFTYVEADFSLLEFAPESFDLVTSSIAIHHLQNGAKRRLWASIFAWLSAGGWLALGDQMAAATSQASQQHNDAWRREALKLGSTAEDWERWMRHQDEHDHHATLAEHFDGLREAGFRAVDCPWRYLLWTVVLARK